MIQWIPRSAVAAVFLAVHTLPVLSAQEAPAAKPVTIPPGSKAEQLNQQGNRLKVYIRAYQNQQDTITRDMVRLDSEIEGQVERIVDLLASIKDSKDSRIKVIQTQEMAIEGLKKSTEFYVRERNKRSAALDRPYTPMARGSLEQDVMALQERIDKRVEQIVHLTNSLVQQTDFKKSVTYYDRDGYKQTRTTSGQSHNRSVARRASNERDKIRDQLKAGIERIKRDNVDLQKQLAVVSDKEERERLETMIEFNKGLVESRQNQLHSLALPPPAGARPIGNKDAMTLKQEFRDATAEIRKQHQELVRLNARRDRVRVELKSNLRKLAATKAAFDKEVAEPQVDTGKKL